jgi:hypothetical protein
LLPLVLGAFDPIARAASDNGEIIRRVLDAIALILPRPAMPTIATSCWHSPARFDWKARTV